MQQPVVTVLPQWGSCNGTLGMKRAALQGALAFHQSGTWYAYMLSISFGLRSNDCLFKNTLYHWYCVLDVAAVSMVNRPDRHNVPPDILYM